MIKRDLLPGDVVQLGGNVSNPAFAFCFMVVTESKTFGVQGYVQGIGTREEPGGHFYFRAQWEEMEYIGKARFVG